MTRRDAVLRKDSSSPDTSESVRSASSRSTVAAPAKQLHSPSECARRSTFWYSLRSSIESLPTTWSPGLPSFALIRTSAVPATFDRAVPFESAPPAFDSDSPSVWRYTPFTIASITTLLPLIRAPPQISVLVTAADETTMLAVASLSAPRPFALLSAFAVPLIEVVAPIVTSPPAVTVPFTTVFVVCMSSDVALECTPEKRPPPLPDASTDDRSVAPAFTTTFPVAMSCAPVSIVIVVSVVSDVCASASPTDTSPPPPLDVFAPTRPRLSVVMLIVPAWIEAPEPIVFVKIGWTTAFAFADFTSIAPPLEPDDDGVAREVERGDRDRRVVVARVGGRCRVERAGRVTREPDGLAVRRGDLDLERVGCVDHVEALAVVDAWADRGRVRRVVGERLAVG